MRSIYTRVLPEIVRNGKRAVHREHIVILETAVADRHVIRVAFHLNDIFRIMIQNLSDLFNQRKSILTDRLLTGIKKHRTA